MPRSFLVKKHESMKKSKFWRLRSDTQDLPCSTHADSVILSDILFPQKAPPLCSSSSYPRPPPLRAPSLSARFAVEAYRQCVSRNEKRRGFLVPPSVPNLHNVPPSRSSQVTFECMDCKKEHSECSGLSCRCDWSSQKYFSCKYCDKEYVSLGALKMHIRTHTLPCVCKLCGKAFSRPWLLQGHIRTHTGEKPFSCLHCSRAFADRSNLRAHLQTHSEVKKYQCAHCCKTFSRISLLAKHQEASCCSFERRSCCMQSCCMQSCWQS